MCHLVRNALDSGPASCRSIVGFTGSAKSTERVLRRNFRMSIYSKTLVGRTLVMLMGMTAILLMLGDLASAQGQSTDPDRPNAPKWELYGGYSVFYPGATVTGQLPLGIAPLSSRLETNPRGAGATATYDFNNWFGLSLDF